MTTTQRKPGLIVFDLDYTLWPFWVDTHVTPPFTKDKKGHIVDMMGKKIKCYPEVPDILHKLYADGYKIAIASRTTEINGASQLLELFGWNQYFSYKEIYSGSKINHFNEFRKQSGIGFKEMLFFDDESRNIKDLTTQGVTSILVEDGVTWKVIEQGFRVYQ